MVDKEWAIDTVGEYISFTTAILLIGIFLGSIGLFWFWSHNPTLELEVRSQFTEEANYTGGEITFTESQIADLNATINQRLEEYAYCLKIRENRVDEMYHPLRDHNSTENHITTQCHSSFNGHLHTHPGLFSTPEPSQTDKESWANSTVIEVGCVIADPVPRNDDQRPVGLNCYENPFPDRVFLNKTVLRETVEDTEFKQVEVRVDRS